MAEEIMDEGFRNWIGLTYNWIPDATLADLANDAALLAKDIKNYGEEGQRVPLLEAQFQARILCLELLKYLPQAIAQAVGTELDRRGIGQKPTVDLVKEEPEEVL